MRQIKAHTSEVLHFDTTLDRIIEQLKDLIREGYATVDAANVSAGGYDSTNKKIIFYSDTAKRHTLFDINATAFIKDGMVDNVYIDNTTNKLIIVFNTDGGKEPIEIPIDSFFPSSNYYTKTQINNIIDPIEQRVTQAEHDIDVLETNIQSIADILNVDNNYYGIRWNVATGVMERIGNLDWHRSLPIHSKMKRCIMQAGSEHNGEYKEISDQYPWRFEDGTGVNYYDENGTFNVMSRLPKYNFEAYTKTEGSTTYNYLKLYPYNTQIGVVSKEMFIGSFELSLDTNAYSVTSKARSVCTVEDFAYDDNVNNEVILNNNSVLLNEHTDLLGTYGGTGIEPSGTDVYNTRQGRPKTSLTRAQFRVACRNVGDNWHEWDSSAWNCLNRLFVSEYATLNWQAGFNSDLDANGYHQGGLGAGVTTVADSKWSAFNNYNPFIPCGMTVRNGNYTGQTSTGDVIDSAHDNVVVFNGYINSYRSVELPFGHIYKFVDGVICLGDDQQNNNLLYYTCNDYTKYSDSVLTDYEVSAVEYAATSGYIKEVNWNSKGEFFSIKTGTNTYNDYHYVSSSYNENTRNVLFVGGCAYSGGTAGGFCAGADAGASAAYAAFGSRLQYTPTL